MSEEGSAPGPNSGPETLTFVYNVDGSPVAMMRDLYSGITTGSTDCHLCDLTFGHLMKDRSWANFVSDLPIDVDFQLRSTFVRRFPDSAGAGFPAAFVIVDGAPPRQVISREEMNRAEDLDQLRGLVGETVDRLRPGPKASHRPGPGGEG